MITVYPIRLSLQEFETAPKDERLFYLRLGQIANDLASLNRLTLFSLKTPADIEPMNYAGSAMAMMALRFMAGRLCDAHDVIGRQYARLKPRYEGRLSSDGSDALRAFSRVVAGWLSLWQR